MSILKTEHPTYYVRLNAYFPEQELKHPGQLADLVESQAVYHKLETADYLILYAEFKDFLFVDYLLVNENARGQGIGSQVMRKIKAAGKPIILEVEPEDERLPDTILRRKFYARHGFRDAHGVTYRRTDDGGKPFEMDILYFAPDDTLCDEDVLQMMARVCHHVHNFRAGTYYDKMPADPNQVLWLNSAVAQGALEASI